MFSKGSDPSRWGESGSAPWRVSRSPFSGILKSRGGYLGARKANVKARREGWGEDGGWEREGDRSKSQGKDALVLQR